MHGLLFVFIIFVVCNYNVDIVNTIDYVTRLNDDVTGLLAR